MSDNQQESFPVGEFTPVLPASPAVRQEAIAEIASLPARLRAAVAGLDETQLDTPYRAGGWTVRQLVHHIADSHMHAYVRCKLALAEEVPTIKPYDQETWAAMADSRLPPEVSLSIVDGVHARWTALLDGLPAEQFGRTFLHPELGAEQSLDRQTQHYAWHGRHHLAHITRLRERQGW